MKDLGLEITSHMSTIENADAKMILELIEEEKKEKESTEDVEDESVKE